MNQFNYSPRAPEWWVEEYYPEILSPPQRPSLLVRLWTDTRRFAELFAENCLRAFTKLGDAMFPPLPGFRELESRAEQQRAMLDDVKANINLPASSCLRKGIVVTNNKIIADKNAEYDFIVGDKTESK